MMVWSITYHSWLTFVLLLWSCILWMVPNQRKATLSSSPFLVIYSEILLISQYIYGMNLTDDELPQTVDGINLNQIGFVKYEQLSCLPLLVKILYTMMFWISLRQYMQERYDERNRNLAEGVMLNPCNVIFSAAPTVPSNIGETPSEAREGQAQSYMHSIGTWVHGMLAKFWIWVVAIMLFVIGLGEVVVYRIMYMFLFLCFLLTFQLSYEIWRKIMYGFWLVIIFYSMLVLVCIYTYQFDNFPGYWTNYTGIPLQLQHDLGLEVYNTGELFLRLLTPTFFVIITIIQLHYFHKAFLELSDLTKITNDPGCKDSPKDETPDKACPVEPESLPTASTAEKATPKKSHRYTFDFIGVRDFYYWCKGKLPIVMEKIRYYGYHVTEISWRFLEIHISKLVFFSTLLLAVYDISGVHMVFMVLSILGLPFNAKVQTVISHCCAVWSAALLLMKMIYQIDYIDPDNWSANCTIANETLLFDEERFINVTFNNAEWLGFKKTSKLPNYLKGYIGLLIVLTVQAVVKIRQAYRRNQMSLQEPLPGILFPEITRSDADAGILECVKFMANHGFYKFGIEITLVSMIAVIGSRLDLYSVLYSIWLFAMFQLNRHTLAKIWGFFIVFIMTMLPIQYLMCVGIPPGSCFEYPWSLGMNNELREWLFLPDYFKPPQSYKLVTDYILLIFACCQMHVFRIEFGPDSDLYCGGSNADIANDDAYVDYNPVPDYITYTKSFLDMIKVALFFTFYWITLAIVFLAGTNRVSIFAMGYVVGSFVFLWLGNEFYLKPLEIILKMWNTLLGYTVGVIFVKCFLQVIGCVFLLDLYENYCWVVQLFGIACIKKFGDTSDDDLHAAAEAECLVPTTEAGLLWDGICFAFLLFQRRFFGSYYFLHLVAEMKAQAKLAVRGAELMSEMMKREVQEQQEEEKKVLAKIRMKMDRIKATQQKIVGSKFKEPKDHYSAIRSGDYCMFEDDSEDEPLDNFEDNKEVVEKPPGMTISQLMATAMKTNDLDKAVEEAKLASSTDTDTNLLAPSHLSPYPTSAAVSSLIRLPTPSSVSYPDPFSRPHAPLQFSKSAPPTAGSAQSGFLHPEVCPRDMAPTPDDVPELPREDDPSKRDDDEEDQAEKETSKEKWESLFNKLRRLLRFTWQFLRSILVSITKWLNKVSRDYRYVARHLSQEKKEVKASLSMRKDSSEVSRTIDINIGQPNVSNYGVEDVEIRVEKASEDMSNSIDDVMLETTIVSTVDPMDPEFDKDGNVVKHLLIAVWYALLSRSELVCYLMICANQMKSASMLSLPLPFMAFLWGSLSIPRPSRTFWITVIAYTEAIVLVKYMFQFSFFPWNQVERLNAPFWPPRILGVEKKPQYAIYDLALLLVLFFHRFMLKSLGLWTDTLKEEACEEEKNTDEKLKEKIEEVKKKHSLFEKSMNESILTRQGSSYRRPPDEPKLQLVMTEIFQGIKQYLSPVVDFFHVILHPSYHVTVDVYAYMFFCDFLNFLVVVFGFSSFGTQQGDGGVSAYLEENKVPVPFLVMLILQFGLIVIDRALYLRKFIVGKLIFQVVLVFGVHVWMFFILPAVTEREFTAAKPPQVWYMVKCVYLLLSAYQIRSGYPNRILGNFFCKKYNYVNMFFFKGFMLVPFLFELRALMDWIWTDTSMSLSDWLKMEDIFAHIFQLKCQRRAEAEYPVPRGCNRRPVIKYGMGGSALFVIIAIIWFPLVLFALGNTVGLPNPPVDVSVKISVGGYEPFFSMSAQQNSLIKFTEKDWDVVNYHYRSNRFAQTLLGNYDWTDVIVGKLNGNSSSVWTISPPSQERLINDLHSDDPLELRLTWEVTRLTSGPEIVAKVFAERLIELEPGGDVRTKLAHIINGTSDDDQVMFEKLLPKFIKVTNRGGADHINQLAKQRKDDAFVDLILTLRFGVGTNTLERWWEARENCKNSPYTWLPHSEDCQYLTMYTFNEKAFPSSLSLISGGGIIGMYTTLVLVASKLVRGFFAGISFTIMFDDLPNVDKILQLCLDIYLVRESKELSLEEDLFAKLIFLYRSPETLIKWSRDKEQPADEED